MASLRWLGSWTLVAALGVGYWALAKEPGAAVPGEELARLIDQDAKAIQDALAKAKLTVKGKLTEKTARKVRATALLVAHYAQVGMTKDNALAMATLRDRALKIIEAVDDGKVKEAKMLAAGLSAKLKADPNAKIDLVALHKLMEVDRVMRIFSSEVLGGYGLEMELDLLVEVKGALAGDKQQRVIDLANKLTLVGILAEAYVPAKDEPKEKTRKNWMMFAGQLRQTAAALTEAARANRDIGVAANNVSVSCTKCHEIFKPKPDGQ